MNRFFPLLGTALLLGTAAHAQDISNTYTSTSPWGITTTTTVTGPANAVGAYTNQNIYNGYTDYGYGDYNTGYGNYNTGYGNYNTGYGNYNTGYGGNNYDGNGYDGYNYGGYAGDSNYYTFGNGAQPLYPGQSYYIPGYSIPLGQSRYGTPPRITTLPQIVTPFPYSYGYGNYGYATPTAPVYNVSPLGYGSRPLRNNAPSTGTNVSNTRPDRIIPNISVPRTLVPPADPVR